MRRIFIAGGYITPFIGKGSKDFIDKKHPDFGKRENPTLEETLTSSIKGCLTPETASVVDRIAVGNFCGELFSKQGHLGAAAAGAMPQLRHKQSMRVEGACASGALAARICFESLQASADVALVVGAEVQTTVSAREGGDFLARASHFSRQRSIDDFTFPALFARRIKALMEAKSITAEDLALFSQKAMENARLNPLAHMHTSKPQTLAQIVESPTFLTNADLKPYIKLTDCSQVSDGACAIVLATEAGLRKLGKNVSDCVEILSMEVATDNLYEDSDPTQMGNSAKAAQKAFAAAGGLSAKDMQVAEVHDCFTVAEVLMYEALGFAEKGQGAKFMRDGNTTLTGKVPVNTGGGLVGFGHPVGATGVKQMFEVYRQMKGLCGKYQMASRPKLGVCLNMGGDDKTAVCTVLKNC